MKFISIASEKIDIREEDEKWIYIPPRKSIFRLFSINNKLIIYNKFQHTCLPPLYTATNQPSSVYSSLSFFLFSLSTNSPLNINPSEKLLSPFTVRAGRNGALSETGYRPPSPFGAVQFSLPLPPQKNYPFISATRKQVISSIIIVVVAFHSIEK